MAGVLLDRARIFSEEQRQEVLQAALEANCVIVGVHKCFVSSVGLPLLALVPTTNLQGSSGVSFSSLTFKPTGKKLNRFAEVRVDTRAVCDVTGELSEQQFVPHYLAPTQFWTHNSPSIELEITSLEPYTFAPRRPIIVVKMSHDDRRLVSHFPGTLQEDLLRSLGPEDPQTQSVSIADSEPDEVYNTRLPGSDLTIRCQRCEDGFVKVHSRDWTGPTVFSPAEKTFATSVLVPIEPSRLVCATSQVFKGCTLDPDDPTTSYNYDGTLLGVNGLPPSSLRLDRSSRLASSTTGSCVSAVQLPLVSAHKHVVLGLRLSKETPEFVPKARFPVLSRWPFSSPGIPTLSCHPDVSPDITPFASPLI